MLWQKRDQFELGTSYLAWAKQISRFQLLSYLKKNKTKSWLRFDSDLVQTLASEKISRDEQAETRLGYLRECAENLSDKDKELIRLKYELQLSLKEVSARTGRTAGGLKQAYWEIRNTLRDCVNRKLGLLR